MKRFWREVLVTGDDDGHRVELDRRPLWTPRKRPLVLPTRTLANLVAEEWHAAGDDVDPRVMTHTRLASTVIDRMPRLRAAALDELMAYFRTDLICYRASHPPALVALQDEAWDPILSWLAGRYAAPLMVSRSITPIEQPASSLERLRQHIDGLDDWALVALHALAQALGSSGLALAVAQGRLSPPEGLAASLVDECFEVQQWGWDSEADRRQRALGQDVDAAASFLDAVHQPS